MSDLVNTGNVLWWLATILGALLLVVGRRLIRMSVDVHSNIAARRRERGLILDILEEARAAETDPVRQRELDRLIYNIGNPIEAEMFPYIPGSSASTPSVTKRPAINRKIEIAKRGGTLVTLDVDPKDWESVSDFLDEVGKTGADRVVRVE